jgi:hypothetical protein
MKHYCIIFYLLFSSPLFAQQGNISGDLMMNVNFFQRDTNIGAAGNPLYDNLLSGGEAWLGLRYATHGFVGVVRFDAFNHSNLQNPAQALTGSGLGIFNLSKEVNNLTISAGHIYDQIGSGIIFRAYEDRGLLIDNALFGLHLKYKLNDNLTIKGFTGQTKKVFERYAPILKGINTEGDIDLGKKAHITPGIGIVNRTMDQVSIDGVLSVINSLPLSQRFKPTYNTFAMSLYNTLNYGDFTWYAEAALKSKEAVSTDKGLINADGHVFYSTIGFSKAKFGINFAAKRTQNFMMRTSPNETFIKGIYNWQPIIAQIRPQRVIARYTPPSKDLSEQSYSANIFYTPNENLSFNGSYTHINTLEKDTLYREVLLSTEVRSFSKWILSGGIQYLIYNQALYQQKVKEEYPTIFALTPYIDVTYKLRETKSLRAELQYMITKQDAGSWLFGLIEFSMAPKWSFAVSDMYNAEPNKAHVAKAQHYPNVFLAHTRGPHRFTLNYVKQVEGINCTGGVCRYEPAFSGVRLGVTSTF